METQEHDVTLRKKPRKKTQPHEILIRYLLTDMSSQNSLRGTGRTLTCDWRMPGSVCVCACEWMIEWEGRGRICLEAWGKIRTRPRPAFWLNIPAGKKVSAVFPWETAFSRAHYSARPFVWHMVCWHALDFRLRPNEFFCFLLPCWFVSVAK